MRQIERGLEVRQDSVRRIPSLSYLLRRGWPRQVLWLVPKPAGFPAPGLGEHDPPIIDALLGKTFARDVPKLWENVGIDGRLDDGKAP